MQKRRHETQRRVGEAGGVGQEALQKEQMKGRTYGAWNNFVIVVGGDLVISLWTTHNGAAFELGDLPCDFAPLRFGRRGLLT